MTTSMDAARRIVATDFDSARFLLLVVADAARAVELLCTRGLFIGPPRPFLAVVGPGAAALAAHGEFRRFARANQCRSRFYPDASESLLIALAGSTAAVLLPTLPGEGLDPALDTIIRAGKTVLAPAAVLAMIDASASGVAADTPEAFRAAAGRFFNGR
jgi:hypothetical protein